MGVFEVEPAERERDRAGVDIDVRLVEEGGVDRCTGRLALTLVGDAWRIDPGSVVCRPAD